MARRSKKAARRFSKRRGSRRMRGGSRRRMRGGWRVLSGAALNDTSMKGPMNMSLRQGEEYDVLHEGQHGGAHMGAPAFQSETLPSSMVTSARVGPTLQAFSEIQGMKDQGGGGRRRRRRRSQYGGDGENMGPGGNDEEDSMNNSSMAGGRRRRKSRGRKSRGRRTRHRRRQGGGSFQPADVSSPTMLLSGNSARHAEGAMNPEWQLAKNPSAFAPM